MRARLIYEKRGGACFVPHAALVDLFSRAARRAGINLRSTEGFSPHAKMSFGPELPAGVVALCEAADLWLGEDPRKDAPEKAGARLVSMLNEQMPEGFRVKKCIFPAEGAPALGKECGAAHYLIWPRIIGSAEKLLDRAKSHFGEDVLSAEVLGLDINIDIDEKETNGENGPRISIVLANPAKNGIGGWVKALAGEGLVAGWQDLRIVRTALGRWNGVRMEPLTEEGVACLRL
ncbi:MAG: TIGR03936 family radical SAM-associated protein [Synergistaceae bacterium]|nr:TIGR03936 family radical SAM-associated protein [Synergistaceae bacterium]